MQERGVSISDADRGSPLRTEEELVRAARGDPGAFGELYRAHYGAIVGYLYRRTGDRHAAEDLACEAFIAAYRGIGKYRSRGLPLRAWLYRIATNGANAWAKRRARMRLVGEAGLAGVVDGSAGREEQAGFGVEGITVEEAQRALVSLAVEHQEVLTLHYLEGLGIEEVAAVLGKRAGTVKSRLARGREAMRRVLEGERHG